MLAGNFGPLSSATAPSIRGFFQPASQLPSQAAEPSTPLVPPNVAGSSLLQSSARAEPRFGQQRPLKARQSAADRKGIASVDAEQRCRQSGDKSSGQLMNQPDIDLNKVSVMEQAHILAGIQRRATSASSAASGLSAGSGSKRSRPDGVSQAPGQEARSVLRKPEAKQRRISDVFRRVQAESS